MFLAFRLTLKKWDGQIGVTLAWVAGILLPLLILGLSYSGSAYCLAKERRIKEQRAE
jgi:hypothetical protein